MTAILERLKHRELRKDFRYDIAGLRGVGLMFIAVNLFGLTGISGGIVGFDLFFVVSGFLVTATLFRQITDSKQEEFHLGHISLSRFYFKSAKRILPILISTVVVVLFIAFLQLDAEHFRHLAIEAFWALCLSTNIFLMQNSADFFAQNSASSPFSHLWALSLGFEFYLFWPFIILLAANMRPFSLFGQFLLSRQRMQFVIGLVSAVSLSWFIFGCLTGSEKIYFSPFGRIWEFAFGALMFLASQSETNPVRQKFIKPAAVFALIVIIVPILAFTKESYFFFAMSTVFAVGFLLFAGSRAENNVLSNRLLGLPILTFVGTGSYAFYVLCGPFIFFANKSNFLSNYGSKLLAMIFLLLLSAGIIQLSRIPTREISFEFLDKWRARWENRPEVSQVSWRAAFALIMISVVFGYLTNPVKIVKAQKWAPPVSADAFNPNASLSPFARNDNANATKFNLESQWRAEVEKSLLTSKLPESLNPSLQALTTLNKSGGLQTCQGFPAQSKKNLINCESVANSPGAIHTAMILGDSRAGMFWPAILESLDPEMWTIKLVSMNDCAVPDLPSQDGGTNSKACAVHREKSLKLLENVKPELTFLIDGIDTKVSLDTYRAAYLRILPRISATTGQVVMVQSTPNFPNIVECLKKHPKIYSCGAKNLEVNSQAKTQLLLAKKYNAALWDLSRILCAPVQRIYKCPATLGNTAVTSDGIHFVPTFSKELGPVISMWLYNLGLIDVKNLG